MKKHWTTYTIGFSELTTEQENLIEAKFKEFTSELNKVGIVEEAFTTDSGEFNG